MESTIEGEVLVIWRSQASFDLMMMMMMMMMMMLTRLLYLSCVDRWNLKFKPKIDGCSEEEWMLEEVIISISCMVIE